MIVAAFDSKHLQPGGGFNGQSTTGIGRCVAVEGGIGDVGRRLRSRNAKSAAFVASVVVSKYNVVQLEKGVFVIVGCGHGTTVESSTVSVEVRVGEGDALFGAGDVDGLLVKHCFAGTRCTQSSGIDQCDIIGGIEWVAWDA